MDKILKHVVSTACRPRVFQIALFKGFPNLPHISPPPLGHSAVTNEATKTPTPENALCWHKMQRPREIFFHSPFSPCPLLLHTHPPRPLLFPPSPRVPLNNKGVGVRGVPDRQLTPTLLVYCIICLKPPYPPLSSAPSVIFLRRRGSSCRRRCTRRRRTPASVQ